MIQKLKKNIVLFLAVGILIYLLLSVYADFNLVVHALSNFNWLLFPILLILSLLNYYTRFLKWDYYLRLLEVKISRKNSFAIFMSGLVMSVTPGKMGELFKAYLVKQISGEPVSRTFPVIFAERVTDFISLVLLALSGVYFFGYGGGIVIGTGIFFLLVVTVASNKTLSFRLIEFLMRVKFLNRFLTPVHNAYESFHAMMKPVPLLLMSLLSVAAWLFECLGFYIILLNFNQQVSFILPVFIYSFATIAGAITMLPAGLGVTEGSLTFLMIDNGLSKELAVSSTFLIRIVTLWFAVLIGFISVLWYQKRIGKINFENQT